jgi:nitrogen fixation protein FixH
MRIPEKYFWPGLIVAILGMSVTVQAYLVFRATSDNGPQILDDYYTKAANYDDTIHERQESSRLGWSAEVTLMPAENDTSRDVQIIVNDLSGTPISGLRGTVELRSPSLAEPLGDAKVVELGPGLYKATIEGEGLNRAGLFDTTVRLKKPEATALFLHEKRHEVL